MLDRKIYTRCQHGQIICILHFLNPDTLRQRIASADLLLHALASDSPHPRHSPSASASSLIRLQPFNLVTTCVLPTTLRLHTTTVNHYSSASGTLTMSCADIFLGVIAILFPPIAGESRATPPSFSRPCANIHKSGSKSASVQLIPS